MRIRTKLVWLGLLPLLVFFLLAGHATLVHHDLERVYEKSRKTDELFKHAADLTVFTYEILANGGKRPLVMWQDKWQQIAEDQKVLHSWAHHPDELYLLDDIKTLLGNARRLREEYQTAPDLPTYREALGRRLLIEVKSLQPLAENLNNLHHLLMRSLNHRHGVVNNLILSILAVVVSLVAFALIRTIASSLSVLRTGIQAMADGHLGQPIPLQGRDELAEVAGHFNQMTERLHQTTVSRDDLQREVQERIAMEEKLRASELRFRTVADFTYDWEYWTGPNREMLYVSPACERITGYNREAFMADGGLLLRIVHPEDQDRVVAHQAMAKDQELSPIDFRVVHRDGGMRWIGHACQPVHDQSGQFLGRRSSNRDITDRMEAEEEYQTIVQTALDGFWIMNMQGHILAVNDAYCQMIGYNRDELLTMTVAMLEAVETPEGVRQHVDQIRQDGHGRFETRHRHKDGFLIDLEISVRHLSLQGGVLIAFLRDITERHRAEAQLAETMIFNEQIIAKSSVGIVVYHHQGPCVLANEAAAHIVGASRERLLSQNFREISSWRDNGLIDLALASLAERQPRQQEVFVKTTFGVETWLNCHFTPLVLQGQDHLLLLFTDVSHYRHAQQAMALAKTAAEEANRAKSEFLANMSHEIRTPMNAILGMADLLWESHLAVEQRKYVQVFRSAGETLMGILNDILDFSKIEAGHMELEEIDLHLEEEVETVCEIMAPRAHGKGLELAWRIAPEVPVFLRGDPVRLRQILLNLLSNAVKFTEEGEVELNVEQYPSPRGEDEIMLAVSVRDTGTGIAPNRLASIFESFVQADLSMTRRFGGTGLGLAIVKRLVEHMGGQVTVESMPGRGSTFCFTVGLRRGADRRDPLPSLDLHGVRTLVVDDTEANRLVLREILERVGATVIEASDGHAALLALDRAKAEAMPFHLLLLDVRMPGMDGFQVVECWRAAGHPGVPILMLTSDHRERHRERCAELGVHHYLVKPTRHAALLLAIAAALGLPEAVSSPLTAQEPDHSSEKPPRILLADDSDDNRLLIQAFLDKTAYELDFAENGAMALDKMKIGHYGLVLMDVQMPVMDGYSATRAWRAWEREHKYPPIPIIALTAYALQEDIDRSLASGCNDHLTKPIRKRVLLETISRHDGITRQEVSHG